MFYCMFYFTCDRSFNVTPTAASVDRDVPPPVGDSGPCDRGDLRPELPCWLSEEALRSGLGLVDSCSGC